MLSLQKHPNGPLAKQVLLVILDGVGFTKQGVNDGNAVEAAKMPVLKNLWQTRPTLHLRAHGTAVGMPSDEDMGNSEVGHNVLGSGRIFDQGAKLVSASIDSKEMFQGPIWKKIIQNVKTNNSTLHFLGLLSDGNVHSHIDHLRAMIDVAQTEAVPKIRLHILLDGRDVPEKSALDYLTPLESHLSELKKSGLDISVASGGGRMEITMDRYEADWSMVERGWKVHVLGEGRKFASATEAIETFRKEDPNVIDQYLPSFVVADPTGKPVGSVEDGDSVIFFNFRGDRSIEISRAFTEENFAPFNRIRFPKIEFAGMMQYDGDSFIPKQYLVSPPVIDRTMGEYLVNEHVAQYAISETQKYGHVTFFWNGNKSGYFNQALETYEEVKSDVIPFDQKPEMKAKEITDTLIQAIQSHKYPFLRVNYANGDMVGHTGNMEATVKGLEYLDSCIDRLVKICKESGTVLFITADHGNADEMYQLDKKGHAQTSKDGKPVPKTSHTLNPVHFVVFDPESKIQFVEQDPNFGLANIAATVLDVLGFEAPVGYHQSLIRR
ncbi:putative 2,3-bisphosphoglycerate-independent phosphoglycerate mutase [Leptospira kobayashii]|uniref:2,3-bisphosphoglycerate-independent phosphoglycerate mutase n=1 Tax=Leptospira kobayashii TaxID=1917830 RepID=A0ABN6KJ49_9LEPT|nr:2,3-bisphosphoglycerate-independent phosphoglycerate mutase [Leptospira kobayashii]BDA80131.1 putative 2,3-bisphosphoglycerate-independent phosphoglycerate mutase [Leptospira kobayashii]